MTLRGDGVAAMVPTREGSVFVAEGLADPPDGHTYQLWLLEGTQPVSAGTFDVGSPEPTTDPVVQTT